METRATNLLANPKRFLDYLFINSIFKQTKLTSYCSTSNNKVYVKHKKFKIF